MQKCKVPVPARARMRTMLRVATQPWHNTQICGTIPWEHCYARLAPKRRATGERTTTASEGQVTRPAVIVRRAV